MSTFDRRQFCSASASSLLLLHMRRALQAPLAANGSVEFLLYSPVANPFFAWPRTLLSYPNPRGAWIDPGTHHLYCVETAQTIPFQISHATTEKSAELLFLADLPANSTRTYRMLSAPDGPPQVSSERVSIVTEATGLTIDTGAVRIRVPATQTVTGQTPGPILQIGRGPGGKWFGSSSVKLSGHSIASIQTEELEAGPLRSKHRITYTLTAGPRYIVTIECIAGMDFIRLHEDMEAFPSDIHGRFEFAWTGCDFSHRQAPNHPYNFPRSPLPDYRSYPWESIAPQSMDTQFGVSRGIGPTGQLPFSLRLFEPWSDALAASFANFWSDTSAYSAAVFIDHAEQWEDHEYAIWHSSPRLAVDLLYNAPTLSFLYQLGRGTRSTCLSFYEHGKDIAAMNRLENITKGVPSGRATYRTSLFPTSHSLELQQWHGTLNLNKTKDWVLSYPATAALPRTIFTVIPWKDAAEFFETVDHSGFLTDLALSGVRQNHGFGPTSSRMILDSWVPGYQIFRSQLTPEQRRRIEGVLLLLAYVHAGEDYMPMQRMLSGHPNFLSDVKSTPSGMAFLFPEHPAADTWAEEWEAYLNLNTRYHTRPGVAPWDARGGRWTENLGTYVWAFLRPASRASFLLKCRDGHERLCTPELALLGDWLVNALSAPFAGENAAVMKRLHDEAAHNEGSRRHNWGIVSSADGPRRVHPPLGAHSERRKPPRTMWYLGKTLMDFSPLTAEHLMWAARPTDQDMEVPLDGLDSYSVMFAGPDNCGTNPHLRSAKYTGFGITLRAAVDTPQEVSLHLMQIDDGPNYRWGFASEGSCGVLYFFANQKGYSHNGGEDIGDRVDQDTDFCTNFGVWKDGAFRSIGQNVLARPLYDVEFAQFAEIVPRSGANVYSSPEYVSRSILLAADDYFILHDKVFNPEVSHRFSWFVRKGDEFPQITRISPAVSLEAGGFTTVETDATTGKWSEGRGDSLVVVTHKEGLQAVPKPHGAEVVFAGGRDLVFASQHTIHFEADHTAFSGTAGILRTRAGTTEIALFHGTHIASAGLSLTTTDTELGIAATLSHDGGIAGVFFAPSPSAVEIGLPPNSEDLILYIDGTRTEALRRSNHLTVPLPAGRHRWELSATLPTPLSPDVDRTESTPGGVMVYGSIVASADTYIFECSEDGGASWKEVAKSSQPSVALVGLVDGRKYHVRLIAHNSARQSAPGPEYPFYITGLPPAPPSGLQMELKQGCAHLRWGQVLGITKYCLYRRKAGDSTFHPIYTGRATSWDDYDVAILPPSPSPGASLSTRVAEYYVSSVNHIGEGRPSRTANSNPASWRNFNPTPGEPFRRTVALNDGALPNDGAGPYYPK